jgi:hypothetical protein
MFNSPAWGRILLGFEDTVLKTLLFPFLSTLFLLADAPYEQILIQYHQTRRLEASLPVINLSWDASR